MVEMALSYFTTVLVIANVGYLQALFKGKAKGSEEEAAVDPK
jgi:cbb3-type cytochrome oxidase subunit 3